MLGKGLPKQHFEKVLSKYLQSDSKNAVFQFSNDKSKEALSWHSNKNSEVTAINSTFVDAYVKNTFT